MQTGVTGASNEIFVVDFDTLFTIGSEIFISRVLPFWQGHRVDAQFTHDYKIDSFSTEEVPHQDTPIVQPPPQKRTLAALQLKGNPAASLAQRFGQMSHRRGMLPKHLRLAAAYPDSPKKLYYNFEVKKN